MSLDVINDHFGARSLSAVVDQIGAGVIITDRLGTIRFANAAFSKITGYARNQLEGQTTRILKSGMHSRSFYAELWQTILQGKVWEGELINRSHDGSLIYLSSSITPVYNSAREIDQFIYVCVDVTEKARLQKEIRQRDKLESLGALAGGIAHDFRNILSAIVNQADLAIANMNCGENSPQRPEEIQQSLKLILETAREAGTIVQRLVDFHGPADSGNPALVSLESEIRTVTRLLASAVPANVSVQCPAGDMDYWVKAFPLAIQQVLLNLGLNASDAIGDRKGFIRMEVAPITISAEEAMSDDEVKPGEYILIRVIDNGPGIPEAVRKQIFEPFFSTKNRSDRNGLGLANVTRLVNEMGGVVSFESRLGVGTRFDLRLPLAKSRGKVKPPATIPTMAGISSTPASESRDGAPISILYLEDDPAISQGACIILESCGFSVDHCSLGGDAIALLKRGNRKFDLVVCDYHLPDMDAPDLIRRTLELYPEQRFVIVSGSLFGDDQLGDIKPFIDRIYNKPVSYFTLAQELHLLKEGKLVEA